MKEVSPYYKQIHKAYNHWSDYIAPNYPRVDFRTWLKVKYRVFLNRNWTKVQFESTKKELMFVLRFS